MPNYRLKCQNNRCGVEAVRAFPVERFEKIMQSKDGHKCQRCNSSRMKHTVSHVNLKDKLFDGWGWHDGLSMTFKGPNHYRAYLREQGLIEVGNDPFPKQESTLAEKEFFTDDMLRATAQITGGLDGQLVNALKDGDVSGS
jgi:hypothetical protein